MLQEMRRELRQCAVMLRWRGFTRLLALNPPALPLPKPEPTLLFLHSLVH